MTSSRLDSPTHTTGAHRAPRRAPRSGTRTLTQRPPARYEPYLDGLFTYCLAVLSDHDAATAVLGDVLAVSERQFGRCPTEEPERRAWLYAIARWACLRRLAERRSARQGAHAGRTGARTAPAATTDPAHHTGTSGTARPASSAAVAEERRRELALLAWPEAAGTTPEQREALELAVRHQLTARQVATVLRVEPPAARELLAAAACEVERTRAALAVVRSGACPSVSALAGDDRVLLSAALRNELVRHVDDCPRCRRAAERAGAGGPWPGSSVTPDRLPLVEAERAAAYAAMLDVPRARASGPRFGRDGFPLDPRDQAARRERLRARAVTTTVVATVVAAPVIALWAAYRGAPLTGETRGGPPVSAADNEGSETRDDDSGRPERYENAASARSEHAPGGPATATDGVAVQVLQPGTPPPPARPGSPAPGRITVAARPHSGDTTVLTLTASGGAPVEWSLWTDAPWLYADRTSGTLAPGQSATVYISVDHEREPAGPWSGRVGVDPVGAVVGIDGHGDTTPPRPGPVRPPRPTPPASTPPPTDPEPTTPAPTPTPTQPTTPPPSTDPTPAPTPTDPSPTPTDTSPGDPPPAGG
ncbi:hypothetical protein [Streptomyces sp. NPDC047097]|uniref:BACON domain-containing protein n=1 Tax=Streptomyces sp. NPDC047097 TaxID=3155260 RepID=UPI0033C4E018